jgi:drug/metabolite transporter (DMT)-like permease
VLYGMLVSELGAGRSLVVTYLNPLLAVGLGTAILGERPGTGTVAGLILILAGSYLSTSGAAGPVRAPRRDAPACGDYRRAVTQTLNEEA